jgi:hypothetical protein
VTPPFTPSYVESSKAANIMVNAKLKKAPAFYD